MLLTIIGIMHANVGKQFEQQNLLHFRESDLSNRGYLQLAQEMTYQWLGAFTTPAWWSEAHLNKALVGYLAAETAFKVGTSRYFSNH